MPGVRATALQKIFTTALASTLKANSYANFSACFPTPAQHCPAALEGVWKQLNTKLEEGCTREFEAILRERNVVEGLGDIDFEQFGSNADVFKHPKPWERALEQLANGEMPPKDKPQPTAEELYTAHLMPYLQRATQMLESRLQFSQQENQALMEKITAQRAEIERLVGGIEGVIRDLEGSVEVMDSGVARGVEGLRTEVWEMEEEAQAAR